MSDLCARSACNSLAPADWFNLSTRQLYCRKCAEWINRENTKDAERLYGQPNLCLWVPGAIDRLRDLEARVRPLEAVAEAAKLLYEGCAIPENSTGRKGFYELGPALKALAALPKAPAGESGGKA